MHHEESFFGDPRNWVVLAFILFFVLFGRKLWGALAGLLDARATTVKAELDEASRLRQEAETMLQDAEKQRAAALTDAKSLIERAQDRGHKVGRRRRRGSRDFSQTAREDGDRPYCRR